MPHKHSVCGVHVYQLHINMFPVDSRVFKVTLKNNLMEGKI